MPKTMGFWVDLAAQRFDDAQPGSGRWIHALPVGSYEHFFYGDIELTPERITRFAQNVKGRVINIDPAINYDHRAHNGEAAGWVKDAEARTDGLWLFVEFTAAAISKLKDKAYRYFSSEIADEWTHPGLKKQFKDVLLGGALTNYPFMKDLVPINFSEVMENDPPQPQQQGGVTVTKEEQLKAAAVKLGLPENSTEEQVFAALSSLDFGQPPAPEPSTPPAPSAPPASPAPPVPPASPSTEVRTLSANEIQAYKQLADHNPSIRGLLETVLGQQRALAAKEKELRLSNVNSQLDAASVGSAFALAPAVRDQLRDVLLDMPKKFADPLYQVIKLLTSGSGLVPLGESAPHAKWAEVDGMATKRYEKMLADAVSKGESYSDAAVRISRENTDLWEAYQEEATSFYE